MSEIRADKLHNASGDNDSGIDLSTNDQVDIKIADSVKARVDSSGNVSLGTTSITTGTLGTSNKFLEVAAGTASGSGTLVLSRDTTTDNDEVGAIRFVNANNADDDGLDADGKMIAAISTRMDTSDSNAGDDSGGHLTFSTKPEAGSFSEQMRITDQAVGGGGHTIGAATITGTGFNFRSPTDGTYLEIGHATGAGDGYSFVICRRNGTALGGISQNGTTGVDFDTTSDYRLKENVTYDFDATTRLKQLQPCRFNFIAEPNRTIDGFLAHEVTDAVPQAVKGDKDAVDENGDINPQMIDQSKLVPLLVKTIQELEARITALESE